MRFEVMEGEAALMAARDLRMVVAAFEKEGIDSLSTPPSSLRVFETWVGEAAVSCQLVEALSASHVQCLEGTASSSALGYSLTQRLRVFGVLLLVVLAEHPQALVEALHSVALALEQKGVSSWSQDQSRINSHLLHSFVASAYPVRIDLPTAAHYPYLQAPPGC